MNFLNVDLEIESDSELQLIVEEFGDRVFNLYCGEAKGNYLATFELSDVSGTDADLTIYNFCVLIESFGGEAKNLWDSAFSKVFDIGYERGSDPNIYSSEIHARTIEKVSRLGASIRLTVYPPRDCGEAIANS